MIAYKLFRQMKNGAIKSLFINKQEEYFYNVWMEAKECPTKGFAFRPYWHCTSEPIAPHLSEKGRVWRKVEMDDFQEMQRPESQGGKWYLAKKIKILDAEESTLGTDKTS